VKRKDEGWEKGRGVRGREGTSRGVCIMPGEDQERSLLLSGGLFNWRSIAMELVARVACRSKALSGNEGIVGSHVITLEKTSYTLDQKRIP